MGDTQSALDNYLRLTSTFSGILYGSRTSTNDGIYAKLLQKIQDDRVEYERLSSRDSNR